MKACKRLTHERFRLGRVAQAGNTALHNASYEGWAAGVQLLLEAGAKVNASNNVRARGVRSARPLASPKGRGRAAARLP